MYVGDGTWDSSRNTFLLPNLMGLNFETMQYNGQCLYCCFPVIALSLTSSRHGKPLPRDGGVSLVDTRPWCDRDNHFPRTRSCLRPDYPILSSMESILGGQISHMATSADPVLNDGRVRSGLVRSWAAEEPDESAPWHRLGHLRLGHLSDSLGLVIAESESG